jgi:hypothetical protein
VAGKAIAAPTKVARAVFLKPIIYPSLVTKKGRLLE